MEITSFILGVCAVILLLMVAGTSVNYMAIKILRKDIDSLNISSTHGFEDTYRQLEKLQQELDSQMQDMRSLLDTRVRNTVRLTDSRADKLDNKLGELDNRLMGEVTILLQDMRSLRQEISRVEKNYKEKINY